MPASSFMTGILWGGTDRKRKKVLLQEEQRAARVQQMVDDINASNQSDWDKVDMLSQVSPQAARDKMATMQQEGKMRALQDTDLPISMKHADLWRWDPQTAAQLHKAELDDQAQAWAIEGQRLDHQTNALTMAVHAFQAGDVGKFKALLKAGGVNAESAAILPRDAKTGKAMVSINGEKMNEDEFMQRFIIAPKQQYDRGTQLLAAEMRGWYNLQAARAPQETTPKDNEIEYAYAQLARDKAYDGLDDKKKALAARDLAYAAHDLQKHDPKYVDFRDAFKKTLEDFKKSGRVTGSPGAYILGHRIPFSGTQDYSSYSTAEEKGAKTATETEGPSSTTTPELGKTITLKSWDEGKDLDPGTRYIGPDGQPYVKGR